MIRRIHCPDELERLVPAWQDLLGRAPRASPFQSPGWLLEWWRAFGVGRLHVIVDEADGALHGMAPFFIRPAGAAQAPSLVLVGTGNSDSLDAILDGECRPGPLIGTALEDAARNGWECDWRRLPPGSPLLTIRWDGDATLLAGEPCPELHLPASDAEFERSLRGRFRRNLRSCGRRADQLGRVEFDFARGGLVQPCLDDLFRLHAERWESKAMRGVLADAAVQRFHRAVAARLDRDGLLRLVRMRIDGEAAAVYYGFQLGTRACFYLGGFNPRFGALSPGSQIIRQLVRTAIDDGVTTFDFLAGQEPYKYAWGAVDRPFFTRQLHHRAGAASG